MNKTKPKLSITISALAALLAATPASAEKPATTKKEPLDLTGRVSSELSLDYYHVRGPKVFQVLNQRQEQERRTHTGRISFNADINTIANIFVSGEYYGEIGAQHAGKVGLGYVFWGDSVSDNFLAVSTGYAIKDYDFNVAEDVSQLITSIDKTIDGQGLYVAVKGKRPSFRYSVSLANYWGDSEATADVLGNELKFPFDNRLLQVAAEGEVRIFKLGDHELRALAKISYIDMDEHDKTQNTDQDYLESEFGLLYLFSLPGVKDLKAGAYLTGGVNDLYDHPLDEHITEGKVSAGAKIRLGY